MDVFLENTLFEGISKLEKGEYENCEFVRCDFSEADFTGNNFVECHFKDCNLSMVNLKQTAFREVVFEGCKLLGLRFDECNVFGLLFQFKSCQLAHATFYKTKIKKTLFTNSDLQHVDFSEAELKESKFENCNLLGAVFDFTNLENADFRTSYHYVIDPEKNKIKHAKFSIAGLPGLLQKYDIQTDS